MILRPHFILASLLVSVASFSAAQEPGAQDTSQSSEARTAPASAVSGMLGVNDQTGGADTEAPPIPAIVGGAGTSLSFLSEMGRSNYLRGGINVGFGYDDNALLSSTGQIGNTTYSVFPNIEMQQSTSRTRWTLSYGAGLTVNQRLTNRDQGSHDLRFDSAFRLSPHVNLRVSEDFSLIAGIFTNIGPGPATGENGFGNTLVTPLANQRSSQTVAETNYHFALNDVVGASGSFNDLHYSEVAGTGSLLDTRTASGSAFWQHQLFHGNWAGASYTFDRMTFGSSGDTRVHSFLAVDTFSIAKRFSLSGFLGPEYSDSRLPGTNDFTSWSVAGGVDGGWHSERSSLAVGYSKRVSNGNGLLGAVRLNAVHAAFRRDLYRGWDVGVSGSYGRNETLTPASFNGAMSIKTTSAGFSLSRNLGKNLGFQFGYSHDFQSESESNIKTDADRNRLSVTLSYQWSRAIGR